MIKRFEFFIRNFDLNVIKGENICLKYFFKLVFNREFLIVIYIL